jgi:Mn-containing catalase
MKREQTNMPQVKELLIEELKDLLHAETQLTAALPKMADAANHPKLKEAFEKHLLETQGQVERLRTVFGLLGENAEPKPCKAMLGLIQEGEETIDDGREKDSMVADLALIAAAQKVEHYEIASYGTARVLAKQLGELESARLLSHTLGEEERSDFLLSAIAEPLIQQASLNDMGAEVNLGDRETVSAGKKKRVSK